MSPGALPPLSQPCSSIYKFCEISAYWFSGFYCPVVIKEPLCYAPLISAIELKLNLPFVSKKSSVVKKAHFSNPNSAQLYIYATSNSSNNFNPFHQVKRK